MAPTRAKLVGLLLAAAIVAWANAALAADSDVSKAAAELREKYVADLETLAKWCDANGLKDEARKTRRVVSPSDPVKFYVPVLPDDVGPPKLPDDAPPKVVEWDAKLWKLRGDYATAAYDLARNAVRTGTPGLAFGLALERRPGQSRLRARPPTARLSEVSRSVAHALRGPKKLRAGFVWSDKFGWLPKASLPRYEKGERYCDGRWISAEEDAKRHRDIRSGWNIETEHYMIRTNHSIEAAVALGVKLERLNRLWQRLFIRYYASEADVVALFEGRLKSAHDLAATPQRLPLPRPRRLQPLAAAAAMPNIEITTGFYFDNPGRAYFFVGKDCDDRIMYHEATHQLFHESRPVAPDVGRRFNFWIVEGIAMFMESLRREDGYDVLGGFDDERLHAAQYRLLGQTSSTSRSTSSSISAWTRCKTIRESARSTAKPPA